MEVTINWQDETYVLHLNGDFIWDNENLFDALGFALQVADKNAGRVIVESIEGE